MCAYSRNHTFSDLCVELHFRGIVCTMWSCPSLTVCFSSASVSGIHLHRIDCIFYTIPLIHLPKLYLACPVFWSFFFYFCFVLFLFSGWISVSVSDSQTFEVQSGEEVTLLCSNYSSSPTEIFWFRVTKRSELHCICSMSQPHEPASFCTGIQSGKFEMSTNISTVFLKIKQVDLLDSGLYFCGTYLSNYAVIVHATNVEVQGRNFILISL